MKDLTAIIAKKKNVFDDVYSYSVGKNGTNDFRVSEFKNGDFETDYEFRSKEAAMAKMMDNLLVGETGVEVTAKNKFRINFTSNGTAYRYDRILKNIMAV